MYGIYLCEPLNKKHTGSTSQGDFFRGKKFLLETNDGRYDLAEVHLS